MDQQHIHEYFVSQRQWVTDLLAEIISIPSESGHEAECQQRLYELLVQEGLDCEVQPISNSIRENPGYSYPVRDLDYIGRSNLVVRQKGTGKKIALNSHIDVVPPSPGQEDPYLPRLDEEGRMWARGACDAKGQVAAMALLFKAAKDLGGSDNALEGHIVVEEELGGNGTLAALAAQPDFTADALVNLEPTQLRISPSIRGAVWFDMTFVGIAGHAGSSKNTFSATDKAIAAIALLKQYHKELLESSRGLGLYSGIDNPMPLTVGLFQAGNWPAMVPGKARIAGVLGFLHNTNRQKVMDQIRELFSKEENSWISEGMTIDFVYRHNAVNTDEDHWLVKGMQNACESCDTSSALAAMTASSDGIFYQDIGIPALAFGPGSIGDAHSCHEHVYLDDVVKAAEVLYTLYLNV